MTKKNCTSEDAANLEIIQTFDRDIVRFDKNIANNSESLAFDFKENSPLIGSLLMYLAWQVKYNLFAIGSIDPHDFAKKMGFHSKYLNTIHPSPACLEGLSKYQKDELYKKQKENPEDPNHRIFDSRFENALYLMISKNLTYKRVGTIYKDGEGNRLQQLKVASIRLLESFSIVFQKSPKGKKKLYYLYELDPGIVNNLSLRYVNTSITHFIQLRQKNLHQLYLFVKDKRDTAVSLYFKIDETNPKDFNDSYTAQFPLLCETAGINSSEPKDRKKRLVQAFNILKELLPVELIWEKGPQARYAYVPVIIFTELRDLDNLVGIDSIAEKADIFCLNLARYIMEEYKCKHYHEINISTPPSLDRDLMTFLKAQPKDKLYKWYIEAQLATFSFKAKIHDQNFEIFHNTLSQFSVYTDMKHFFQTFFKSISDLPKNPSLIELKSRYKYVTLVEEQLTDASINNYNKSGYDVVKIGTKFYTCTPRINN